MSTGPDDVEEWRGERVARWVRQAAGLDRQFAPVTSVLFDAAALVPGEAVLDVGCGTGPTTRRAARTVGASGRVSGLDISPDMLDAAAQEPVDADAAHIEWVVADATTWTPEDAAFDVVLSRFGVMFFSDPARAFTNLAGATRPGGRLAFVVWQRRDESPLFAVPLHAAVVALRAQRVDRTAAGITIDDFLADDATGPFSLHDPGHLTRLLTGAGWSGVHVDRHRLPLTFSGGLPPTEAAAAALDFGPTRALLAGLDREPVAVAEAAIADVLGTHVDVDGLVELTAAVQVVTATR